MFCVNSCNAVALYNRCRSRDFQLLNQLTGQIFQIENLIPDGTGKGQRVAHLIVVDFGPQHTGGIHKFKAARQRKPLLAAGNTGLVGGNGSLFAQQPIDKRALSHVGNAHDHNADGLTHLSLGFLPLNQLLAGLSGAVGELLEKSALLAVGLHHHIALTAIIGSPLGSDGRIGLVDPVEHDHTAFALTKAIQIGVAGGLGNTGINDLADHIHIFQILHHDPTGSGHMSGIPVNAHLTPPILLKGKMRNSALPIT